MSAYGVHGKLRFFPASGTPGEDDYEEDWYKIVDRPGYKDNVRIHNGDRFSIDFHGRWQDVYVDYGKEPIEIRRWHTGTVVDIGTGQHQARLYLGE